MKLGWLLAAAMLVSAPALADDAGTCAIPDTMCGASCTDTTADPFNCGACGTVCPANPQTPDAAGICNAGTCVPVACDGALCDTTNGGTCDVGRVGERSGSVAWLVVFGIAVLALRRRRSLAAAVLLLAPSAAHAAPPGPVDVTIHDAPPPRRWVSIAWNPVSILAVGKLSFDVVIVPIQHHALVLSPFYASTSTAPVYVPGVNGAPSYQLPHQTFTGWGGEIGYRYYSGLAGPRGVFVGPSFIIGAFTATAQDGTQTSYWNLGGAIDVGYQMLVADCVSLAAGLGLQYTFTDKTLPNQQWPANIYANDRFNPRFLLSLGWAF